MSDLVIRCFAAPLVLVLAICAAATFANLPIKGTSRWKYFKTIGMECLRLYAFLVAAVVAIMAFSVILGGMW